MGHSNSDIEQIIIQCPLWAKSCAVSWRQMKNEAWPLPSESSQSRVGERIKSAIATHCDVG